jgi:hypothetical protein
MYLLYLCYKCNAVYNCGTFNFLAAHTELMPRIIVTQVVLCLLISWQGQIADDKMSNSISGHPLQRWTQNVDYNDAKYSKRQDKKLKHT